MPLITLAGIHPSYDGAYVLDLSDSFSYGELHTIKEIAGVRVGELDDAMTAGDSDVIVALAKIAVDRSGNTIPVAVLMGATAGGIQFGPTEAEKQAEEVQEQIPPVPAPPSSGETESETSSSGTSTSNGSDVLPETALPGIGVPG